MKSNFSAVGMKTVCVFCEQPLSGTSGGAP